MSEPHRMTKQVLSWPYCAGCGLVALRNDATRRALRKPCPAKERERAAERYAARMGWT